MPLSASSWILSHTRQHQVRLREAMREAANICTYVSSSKHFRGYRARSAGVRRLKLVVTCVCTAIPI